MAENKNAPVTVGAADEGKAGAKLGRSLSPHTYYNEATFNRQGLFEAVRAAVPALKAARFYGLQIDQHGRALCPFHNDTHPSMSFKWSRFRCWSCGASGDAVDLVRQLFGLTPLGAVRRLNEDFRLGLELDRPLTSQERTAAQQEAERRRELRETEEAFEDWRLSTVQQLNAVFRTAHEALQKDGLLTDAEIMAIAWQSWAEYMADTLESGTMTEKMAVFREREGVTARCATISCRMPQRSEVA